MDAISKKSEFSRKNVDDYTCLAEIISDVESLTQENFYQTQANEILERYLRKKSPQLIIGMERPPGAERLSRNASELEAGAGAGAAVGVGALSASPSHDSATASPLTLTRASTGSSPGLTSRSMLHTSITPQRVNVLYRLEMVEREIEEGKMNMDKLRKRFESAKFLLQTEEENLKSDLENIQASDMLLEKHLPEITDKKTGRVFNDKYLRFLEMELEQKDRELRKMKLRTRTYQTEYNRIKAQQQQKIELRERLHPVDLEKLRIENEELLAILEGKTRRLMDMKRAVGKKGQNLISLKSKLNDTLLALKNVAQDIKQKESKFAFTEAKEIQNINDLMEAEMLNQSIKKLNNTYRSPDVHTYLQMEVALADLQREKQVWERRCRNQRQTLGLLEHQLKQLAPPADPRRKSKSIYGSTRSARSASSSIGLKKVSQMTTTPISPL